MLDHLGIGVRDLGASRRFYEQALAPLDYQVVLEVPKAIGLGAGGKPDFWLEERPRGEPVHIAFAARDRSVVDAFHAAGLAAGGQDNGGPGVREQYHPTYYGAYVFDPDGNNVEAVCHAPA